MAIKFLQNLDLASNAISGLVVESGTLPTSSLTNGRLFVDGTDLKYYNGSAWKTLNDQSFSLSAATSNALGGIKIGYSASGKNYAVQLDGSNKAYVNVNWTDTQYTLPEATDSALGGVMLSQAQLSTDPTQQGAGTEAGKYYPVQMSKDDTIMVNVPWTDTNTQNTYVAGSGLSLSSFTFSLDTATSGEVGGIKIGYTESGKKYPVELDSGKAFVEVPWSDTTTSLAIEVDGTSVAADILGGTLDFISGGLIDVTHANTGDITIDADLSELTTRTTVDESRDYIALASSDADGGISNYGKILVSNIHIDELGDAEADVAFGANKLTGVKSGVANTDGVNKGQMDTAIANAITSGMDFKGSYSANTALPSSAELGDTYAVTAVNAGSGPTFDPVLEVGDLIICDTAYTAGNAAPSKFVAVQTNIQLADASTTVKGIASFADTNFTVTSGAVSLDNQLNASSQQVGSATQTVSVTANKQGIITALTEQTISIPHTQVNDFDTEVDGRIKLRQWYGKATVGVNSTTLSFVHDLGSKQLVMNLIEASSGEIVMAEMITDTVNVVKVKFAESVASYDTYELAVQKVEVPS